ncbi:hypothetical protein TNIN_254231 [Trichonephila inaurata madagascariensis]|uniref:Uncharacterized protein n=1 Tax=Trichonephila inaurata madagascariensis TaxID=2747483 RepID=A0A8X6XFW1_9ARAC|nr:hypothetical protein TNIN_254231 [Trichonephila inaurata madagascariensis]
MAPERSDYADDERGRFDALLSTSFLKTKADPYLSLTMFGIPISQYKARSTTPAVINVQESFLVMRRHAQQLCYGLEHRHVETTHFGGYAQEYNREKSVKLSPERLGTSGRPVRSVVIKVPTNSHQ